MSYKITPKKISELKSGKEIVEIKVRVLRRWKNEVMGKSGYYYIDLILIDQEGDTIQATINKNIWRKFDAGIVEGNSYLFSKFTVTKNDDFYEMATMNSHRIWIDYSTRVIAVDMPSIPNQKFSFTSFDDIINLNVNPKYYVDVIGEFAHYHPIHTTRNNDEWTTIDLEDLEGTTLSCSIWKPYTEQVIKIIHDQKMAAKRPILVLQFVQPKVFNDNVSISTTRGATRILVNPDTAEVAEFIKRKTTKVNSSEPSRLTETGSEDGLLSKKTLIKSLEQINNGGKAGDFVTKVTILNIDSTVPWYYNSCSYKNCRSKAVLESSGLWYCTNKNNCPGKTNGMKTAVPRFQVKFFVTGGADVFAELMMFDNHINSLVKKSAATLSLEQDKMGDRDAIPLELEVFIDREVVVKFKVSRRYNIENQSTRYTVSSLSFDRKKLDKWSELFHSLEKGKSVADLSESEGEDLTVGDSGFSGSSLESIRKRRFSDAVSPTTLNMNEISPLADKTSTCKKKT